MRSGWLSVLVSVVCGAVGVLVGVWGVQQFGGAILRPSRGLDEAQNDGWREAVGLVVEGAAGERSLVMGAGQMAICDPYRAPEPLEPLEAPEVWLPRQGDVLAGDVVVAWDEAAGAANYNVGLRDELGGGWVFTAPFRSGQSPSEAWGFVIRDVEPGEYEVSVRARNVLCVSEWSEVVSVTVEAR